MNKELRRYIDLLWLLTKKEVTLKYKRTVIGITWSLLNPMILAIIYFFAFKVVMRVQVDNYTLFLLGALFPWTWFSASILVSATCLHSNLNLIKKVRLPREMLVIAVVLAHMVDFLFALPILTCLVFIYGLAPGASWILGIPLLITIQFFIILGIGFIVAALNSYFRDMEYLTGVILNMLFWLTPIIYPTSSIPERFLPIIRLNPIAPLVTAWRGVFINNTLLWGDIGLSLLLALIILPVGWHIFKIMSKNLTEVL